MISEGTGRFANKPGMSYEGSMPYVYVSYAHSDWAQVYPVIKWLMNKGVRVWYDEGIEGGTEWRDVVQRHVQDCAVFLPFITVNFCVSGNCRSEVFIAYEDGKTIIPIYLERLDGSDLKNGLRTALPYKQGIYKYEIPDDNTFYARLASFSAFDPTKEDYRSDLDDTLAGPDATALTKELSKGNGGLHSDRFSSDSNGQDLEHDNDLAIDKNKHEKRMLRVGIPVVVLLVVCTLSIYLYRNYLNGNVEPLKLEPPNPSSSISDETVESPAATVSIENNVGNLINGGYVIHDANGFVYYARPRDGVDWSTDEIVRRPIDGLQEETIYAADDRVERLFHLNVLNDHLVFNHLSSVENSVVSLATDGSDARVIDTCDYYSLCQVDNNLVYYLRDGIIRQYDEKANHYESLATLDPNDSWRIYGDRLFVFKKGSESVKVSGLAGNDPRECYHAEGGFAVVNMYPADGNTIVTFEQNAKSEESRVRIANATDGSAKTLWKGSGEIERVCPYGSGAILTRKNGDQDYTILGVADDGSETIVENVRGQGEVRYTCQIDGLVYYVTYSDNLEQSALHSYNLENHVKRQYR